MNQSRFLPLGIKVTLVAAVFSLPIVVLAFFVVTNINADIRFSTFELAGNAYQRPLEKLLDDVQQYQLSTTGPGLGDADLQRGKQLAAAIDEGFASLAGVDRQFGVDLQFTPQGLRKRGREHLAVDQLKAQWQAIGAQAQGAVAERTAALDTLVTSLREAITHAGDTSNLILDPDLDSYYLMDVTLLALPQTQDRLAKVIAFGRDQLSAGDVSADDRVQFAVFAALLQESDLNRITSSLSTSLNEDANFYGVSPTLAATINRAREEYRRANVAFIDLVRQAAGNDVKLDPAAFTVAGLEARKSTFALWNVAADELDQLLAARVRHYQSSRAVAMAGSGAALAVACVLAYLLTRSITKPLSQLAESLAPGADLLNNSVEMLESSPESADMICEELAAQVGYMRRAVQQLVVVVRGGEVPSNPSRKAPRRERLPELVEA